MFEDKSLSVTGENVPQTVWRNSQDRSGRQPLSISSTDTDTQSIPSPNLSDYAVLMGFGTTVANQTKIALQLTF